MGIGLGAFLLILGAMLSFTPLDTQYMHTNLDTVGVIIMLGGVVTLIVGTVQNNQRTHTRHEEVVDRRSRSMSDTSIEAERRNL